MSINFKKFFKEIDRKELIVLLMAVILGIAMTIVGTFNSLPLCIIGIILVIAIVIYLVWAYQIWIHRKPEPVPDVPEPPAPPPELLPKPILPPYFGASVYELVQQTPEKMRAFLQKLKKAGGNATEIFLVHSHNCNTLQPYLCDDGIERFDLSRWNETFWSQFHHFLVQCKLLGIVPFIRIHDFCSIKRPEISKYYCFLNNRQGFTNVYNDSRIYQYYFKLNNKIIKELRIAGIEKYYIIPMSEADGSDSNMDVFHGRYVVNLLDNGVPQDQIILSTDPKHFDRLKSLGCRLEVHDVAYPLNIDAYLIAYGNFIFPNGDGCHGIGIASWNGYREPDKEQAQRLGQYTRKNNLFGYCYKARSCYQTKDEVHIELADFSALRALVGK